MNVGCNNTGALLTLLARCIPRHFIMIPGRFINDRIFCGAFWAGEPDNVPASGPGDFWFCGIFYHCFKDICGVFSQGLIRPVLVFFQSGEKKGLASDG